MDERRRKHLLEMREHVEKMSGQCREHGLAGAARTMEALFNLFVSDETWMENGEVDRDMLIRGE